jgi:hypothetical protein
MMGSYERPPSWSEPDDLGEDPFEALEIQLELLQRDHAQGKDMHVCAEGVGREQSVEIWIRLAAQYRRLPRIAIYLGVQGLRNR